MAGTARARSIAASLRRHRKLVIGVLALLAALAWLRWWPLPAGLLAADYAALMLDRDGRPLAARIASDEQWRFAPVEHLPENYQQAVLAFEDRRFFQHPGIDPLALARAAWQDLRAGRIVSGGSTLSMQLARILRGNPPRTLFEKSREALLALRLEARLDKQALFRQYASRAPFGGNTVGLRAAAWRYFQRAPGELSWAEAALLAVLPNNPGLIHPGRGRAELRAKRDRLLETLARRGRLDAPSLRLAKLEPLPNLGAMPSLAPQLLDSLLAQGAGPLLHTTLDAGLQQRVMTLVAAHGARLQTQGVHNLAVVVIDHQALAVRAYIGNLTHGDPVIYGRAVNIAASPRSTGSILKPFLYGQMLDAGEILPDTLVPDLPTDFGGYSPQNYDREFRGAVPAREALARSLNVPAVRMLHQHGIARFETELRHAGMSTLFRAADDYGLALILGGAEGRLDELTAMYAQLFATATEGRAAPVRWLRKGAPLLSASDAMSPGAAWLTLAALREVARPGTARAWRLYASAQDIAWKTGTSFGLRDAWAIGSNGRHTVGVWAGNANGEPAAELEGTASAAPLMLDIFSLLGPAPWPATPPDDLQAVTVCKDDGFLAGGLCADTRVAWAPARGHFASVTPNHVRVLLDAKGRRVHSGCAAVAGMRAQDWFVLPTAQAWYYHARHPDYRPLPSWRSDCLAGALALEETAPLALIYPHAGAVIYLPRELGGARNPAVFRAVHVRGKARIFWHLDDQYLGETRHFHEWSIEAAPGWHTLTLIDDQGFRLVRRFKILGDQQGALKRPVAAAESAPSPH